MKLGLLLLGLPVFWVWLMVTTRDAPLPIPCTSWEPAVGLEAPRESEFFQDMHFLLHRVRRHRGLVAPPLVGPNLTFLMAVDEYIVLFYIYF